MMCPLEAGYRHGYNFPDWNLAWAAMGKKAPGMENIPLFSELASETIIYGYGPG